MQTTRLKTTPIPTRRSVRTETVRHLSSMYPGHMYPLKMIPLLREDDFNGRFRFDFDMEPTEQMLLNNTHVEVQAHVVPNLAQERFESMDELDRSYAGEEGAGGAVIPYIETSPFGDGSNEIFNSMGLHAPADQLVNNAFVESYNLVVNHQRKQRSVALPMRSMTDTTLADGFWNHSQGRHIVSDFDQARIDGEVPLTVTETVMPVHGLASSNIAEASGNWTGTVDQTPVDNANTRGMALNVDTQGTTPGVGKIFAELQAGGITISLANIDVAKKTRAFAMMRSQYGALSEEWIIDQLMSGIRITDQQLKQPQLIASASTIFGYAERFASDGASLDLSATRGASFVNLAARVPQIVCGGMVVFTATITPEQLFERQKDYYFFAQQGDGSQFPEYLRDSLDPEQVTRIANNHFDTDHSDPTSTFGYAPLNSEWIRRTPTIGGKFLRPEVDAPADEDRQRIWAVETPDPTLAEDFFLCRNMHTKPFMDTIADPFEVVMTGMAAIRGNTVFGGMLTEATDDYDAVMAVVDFERIDKENTGPQSSDARTDKPTDEKSPKEKDEKPTKKTPAKKED